MCREVTSFLEGGLSTCHSLVSGVDREAEGARSTVLDCTMSSRWHPGLSTGPPARLLIRPSQAPFTGREKHPDPPSGGRGLRLCAGRRSQHSEFLTPWCPSAKWTLDPHSGDDGFNAGVGPRERGCGTRAGQSTGQGTDQQEGGSARARSPAAPAESRAAGRRPHPSSWLSLPPPKTPPSARFSLARGS